MFFIHRHHAFSLTLAALAIAVSACGGGGGGSSPLPGTQPQPTQTAQPAQKTGPANLTILIPPPSKTNTHFRPGYISAGTQSMTVGLVNGTNLTNLATANLTQGSSNCTVPSGGGLQCTVSVQAPFGTDVFSISTYSLPNAGGKQLSTGEVSATLTLGGTTPTVALSLNGVPATVSLALGQSELPVGNAGSTSVIVQAWDASNNLIIGPGIFANALSLAISGDTYKTLSIAYGPGQTNIISPGQVATLNYNGGTNVGSTITVSGSGVVQATPLPTFNATGAVLSLFQYYDSADGIYGDPVSVAALPNGTGAVLFSGGSDPAIGIASPNGIEFAVTGNTLDPYNPGTGGVKSNGMTVINNMSESLEWDYGWEYNELAALPNGNVAYAADFEDNPQNTSSGMCVGGDLYTGVLGILNPSSQTTTEYILKGIPEYIHADANGNVWWVEYSGYCTLSEVQTYFFSDDYAIGELPAGSSTPIETDFANAGITETSLGGLASPDPSGMSISPDGSTMYIGEYDSNAIAKVALGAAPTFSSVVSLSTTNGEPPDGNGMATGPDQTTMWFTDLEATDYDFLYQYIPGTSSFLTAGVAGAAFPIPYFYSEGMAYGDGSFWAADYGDDETNVTGIGRVSNAALGSPVTGFYQVPATYYDSSGQWLYGIAAGGGYVWAFDYEYENVDVLQYGTPSSGTIAYTRVRKLTDYNVRGGNPKPRFYRRHPQHKRGGSRAAASAIRKP